MKVKKEYIILVAVIVGLSAYLLTRKTDRTFYELPQVSSISGNTISRIEIAGPAGKVELTKTDDSWRVGPNNYRADRGKVGPMIDTISDLSLTALVSESKDYPRYDLDDDKKIQVKAWVDATVEREFDIGKPAPSFRHTFVRLAGDPNVYQAGDNFRRQFEHSADDLRDKVVLSFAASDVEKINLSQGGEALSIVRKEVPLKEAAQTGDSEDKQGENAEAEPLKAKMSWLTADGGPADAAAIDQFLSTLSQLTCEKFITDKNKTEFSEPIYTIEVKGQKTYTLSIFAKENDIDTSHPAISSEVTEAFHLAETYAKRLMPPFEDIVDKPAVGEK